MADMRAISICSLTAARAKEAGAGEVLRCRRERKHSIAAAPAIGKYNVGEQKFETDSKPVEAHTTSSFARTLGKIGTGNHAATSATPAA